MRKDAWGYSPDNLAALLPFPAANANKYTRGRLVVVAGCAEYPGAACLAAAAGQRAGAGYVEVFCAPRTVALVQAFRPSLVVRSWEGMTTRALPENKPGKPVAYVVGPGFDAADEECARLALFVLEQAQAPVLVDGGALGALASEEGIRLARQRSEHGLPTIATPHAGEAARLARAVGLFAGSQEELAGALSQAFGMTVVAKGPDTFVSNGTQAVAVRNGTPALAKAGTGDVLAGVAGAFLAQGLAPLDAGVLAATLHAEAGRLAAEALTSISVIPEDVIEYLPTAIANAAAGTERKAHPAAEHAASLSS